MKTKFFESIAKLTALQSLNLSFMEKTLVNRLGLVWEKKNVTTDHRNKTSLLLGLKFFSHHVHLYKLRLKGKLEKLPEQIEFYPPKLLRLDLWECKLTDDPMMILGKLSALRFLGLWYNAYVGKKLECSSGGFLQLERLELYKLNELEELMVEKGAMSSLKTLEIRYCGEMKKLPHGLLQLTNLEKLLLERSTFTNQLKRLKRPGEKIGISSVKIMFLVGQ